MTFEKRAKQRTETRQCTPTNSCRDAEEHARQEEPDRRRPRLRYVRDRLLRASLPSAQTAAALPHTPSATHSVRPIPFDLTLLTHSRVLSPRGREGLGGVGSLALAVSTEAREQNQRLRPEDAGDHVLPKALQLCLQCARYVSDTLALHVNFIRHGRELFPPSCRKRISECVCSLAFSFALCSVHYWLLQGRRGVGGTLLPGPANALSYELMQLKSAQLPPTQLSLSHASTRA
jgi:hypothetical protein